MNDFLTGKRHWLRVALTGLLIGCDFFSERSPDVRQSVQTKISSNGHTVTLGSTSAFAKADEETPRPTVSFSYSFYMDPTETTQGDYEALMGRNPVLDDRFGKGPDFPVYKVSFYDAVLFCNARSKHEGKDTVYSYLARQQDASGRTYELSGLVIHYEREGFRLPTEAEWEYAARGGASTTFPWGETLDSAQAQNSGWYSGNSGGKTHPVGAFPANAFGLKDMLGNVMEWVNDWKKPYVAVPLRDFLGNREPGLVPERVVKGGAFSYEMRYMRYSSRSANYPTLGSAAVEYLGFRCVLGAIQNGQYLSGGGAFAGMPSVTIFPDAIRSLLGHDKAKLVFVNATSLRRTLCYVDYMEKPVTLHEFLDDSTVFAPVISPDGEWVAYGNTYEGDVGPGKIRIRRLNAGDTAATLSLPTGACLPRWQIDSSLPDTFLVYASSCRDNTQPSWAGDATYRIKFSGKTAVGSPELLTKGGYHDGLSGDGAWLASGYRRLLLKNRSTGTNGVLFTGPTNGKTIGDTSQVCNVSMEPNSGAGPDLLLLDFGYSTKSGVVGRPYGLHEVLFRVDTAGNVVKWYGAPSGFVAWQDAEWSNHRDFVVALGESQSGNYPSVVGLNLTSSSTVLLATGSTLRQPGLWIKPGINIAPMGDPGVQDSMGRYNEPAHAWVQEDWASKMKVFWRQHQSAEVICLGSSHVQDGISPEAFTHFHAINLGFTSAGLESTEEILRHYVLLHAPKVRAIIFEISPARLFLSGEGSWVSEMATTLGYKYDLAHDFWKTALPSYMDSVVQDRNSAIGKIYSSDGGYFVPGNGWGPNPPIGYMPGTGALPDPAVNENMARLKKLAEESNKLGLLFVLASFPESPQYKNTQYFTKYGPTWESGKILVAKLDSLCSTFTNCRYYDAYKGGDHDYSSAMALNEDHLSTAGAVQMSHRLDSLIYEAIGPAP